MSISTRRRDPALWLALRDIVLYWIGEGVAHLPRRQSPHQAAAVLGMADRARSGAPSRRDLPGRGVHPAEDDDALAKAGFTQSYTYFTWRNSKRGADRLCHRAGAGTRRRNISARTSSSTRRTSSRCFLQTLGRPGFLIRAALAATLSRPMGRLQRLRALRGARRCRAARNISIREKYEIKRLGLGPRPATSWTKSPRSTAIRRAHPALQPHLGLAFPSRRQRPGHLFYGKAERGPQRRRLRRGQPRSRSTCRTAEIEMPLWRMGIAGRRKPSPSTTC